MSELLPCPFCGRKPEIIHHDTKKEATWCEWEIECTHGYQKPTIQGKDGDEWCFDFAYAGDNLETVIKHWNTRHERMCHIVEKQGYSDGLVRDLQLSCGCHVTVADVVEHCPKCGAKVVDDA